MKIAILNQPTGNRGDESAHKAFVRRLAKDCYQYQIDVIFIRHDQKRIDEINVKLPNVNYINITSIVPLWKILPFCYLTRTINLSFLHPALWKFRRLLNQYDKVVCAPGGMCMGGFKDWLHIWNLETAYRLHKQILYWGRSIGPFVGSDYKSKVFRKNSVKLLKYFSYISLRDAISVKYAEDLGVEVDEIVDSAFLECPNAIVPNTILDKIDNCEYVVFVPNELVWHPHFKDVKAEVIDKFYLSLINMIRRQWPERKIIMLPQTYKTKINDYKYFMRLSSMCNYNNIIVISENQNSDIQQKIIANAKLVIGARYHSIVFAINNETPFISLSYEHKMKGLLERLNLIRYMVDIQEIFDDENDEMIKKTLENIKTIINDNSNAISNVEAKKIVNKGFDNFIKLLY